MNERWERTSAWMSEWLCTLRDHFMVFLPIVGANDKYADNKARFRHCARESCERIESSPLEFKVCKKCRKDAKDFGKKFPRNYYCCQNCYEIDWKQRHGQIHKDLRKKWRKEMEEEEDSMRMQNVDARNANEHQYALDAIFANFDPFSPIYDVD